MLRSRAALLSFVALAFPAFTAPARAALPDVATLVRAADVEKVMRLKTDEPRKPEPGVLFFDVMDKTTGTVHSLQVYLQSGEGRDLGSLEAEVQSQGERVEKVPALGEGAFWRFREGGRGMVIVDGKTRGGERAWLTIEIHEVKDAAANKRIAVELARIAAGRL